jgi:phosphoribosyl-ATP pyrophosphohydrolase/phosphoribosyl-AMP cyclohydrolase
MTGLDPATIDFEKSAGLVPAVVQHATSGAVLMLGYMDRAALVRTLETRRVTFFSRSKQRLWEKGESSGDALDIVDVRADCDRDTLLVRVVPRGPVCHLGTPTCFGADPGGSALVFLAELEGVIASRLRERQQGSYTVELAAGGTVRVAQKLGEEALELVLASVSEPDERVVSEAADMLFHLLVLLKQRGLSLATVVRELEARHQVR